MLREFLLEHQQLSRKSLSQIKHKGDLKLNGQSVTVRAVVKEGDQVEVIYPVEQGSAYLHPEPIPLEILFEDEYIMLINKPPGMCVHPTFSNLSGTLANGVLYYWQQKGLQQTFHPVNRIDKDTSGIVLIAQNKYSHQQLSIEQKKGALKRKYYACVHGIIKQEKGTIDTPIGRSPDSIITREVREDGQHAITHFKVLRRFADYTWVEIELETGRTHQIRVHFSSIGHPLLGDDLYGGRRDKIQRQALHAYYTSFLHPASKSTVIYEAPLAQDMEMLLQKKTSP
ncbi:RluA family pseudouridine synthase [Bacillus horti]